MTYYNKFLRNFQDFRRYVADIIVKIADKVRPRDNGQKEGEI